MEIYERSPYSRVDEDMAVSSGAELGCDFDSGAGCCCLNVHDEADTLDYRLVAAAKVDQAAWTRWMGRSGRGRGDGARPRGNLPLAAANAGGGRQLASFKSCAVRCARGNVTVTYT